MHIQKISNAVSGSMIKVQPSFPERSPYQSVQIGAAATVLEFCHSQTDMSLQHQSEMFFLLLCQFPYGNGSGNICSSLPVLSAGINQEKSLWLYFCKFRFCRRVMTHSSVWSIGTDSFKTQVQAVRVFFSEFQTFFGCTVFCDFSASHILLQPVNETAHSFCVLDMGNTDILHFCLIFIPLHNSRRIGSKHYFCVLRNRLVQGIVGTDVLHQHFVGILQCFYCIINFKIWVQFYSRFF